MFSFFKHKKTSPTPDQGEPIPAADTSGGDEYVMIEPKPNGGQQPYPNYYQQSNYPEEPLPPKSPPPVGYLHGIPFKLSPDIIIDSERNIELARLQVDEILSFITRCELESSYDFSLEREILTQE